MNSLAHPMEFPRTPGARLALGRRAHRVLRQVGSMRLLVCGLFAQFTWAFFGSLHLGLGYRPPPSDRTALLWLAGAVALGVVAGGAARLAAVAGGDT